MSKPRKQVVRLLRFVAVILVAFSMFSCYEPIEGCLDIEATNFSFGADRGDDEMCKYPSVTFNFKPVYGDSVLLTSTIFENKLGQKFSLASYDFMISNTSIDRLDGSTIGSREIYQVYIGDSENLTLINLTQDIQQVSRSGLSVSIPNIRDVGDYRELSFHIGVPAEVHDINMVSYTDVDSPIHIFQDQFTPNGMDWLNWTIMVYREEMMIDSVDVIDTLTIQMNQNQSPILFAADTLFTKTNGQNASFDIQMDFREWLDGVDFDMDVEEIVEICHKNIDKTFSIQ